MRPSRHDLLVELYGAVREHIYLLGAGAVTEDAVRER